MSSDARTKCVIRATDDRTAELILQLRERSGISFSGEGEKFYGRTQKDWVTDYWKWERSYPVEDDPTADETGARCGQGQRGGVWFLTGSTGKTIDRRCTIPAGTALVIPAVNSLAQSKPGVPSQCVPLRAMARNFDNSVRKMHFKIDGVDHTRQAVHAVLTDCFTLQDNQRGWLGTAAASGRWVFLDPLPPGEHTLEFGGEFSDGFRQDIHYRLVVEGG